MESLADSASASEPLLGEDTIIHEADDNNGFVNVNSLDAHIEENEYQDNQDGTESAEEDKLDCLNIYKGARNYLNKIVCLCCECSCGRRCFRLGLSVLCTTLVLLVTVFLGLLFISNLPIVRFRAAYNRRETSEIFTLDAEFAVLNGSNQIFEVFNANWFTEIEVQAVEVTVLYEIGNDYIGLGSSSLQPSGQTNRSNILTVSPRAWKRFKIDFSLKLLSYRARNDIYWRCYNGESLPLDFVGFMRVRLLRNGSQEVQFGPVKINAQCNVML